MGVEISQRPDLNRHNLVMPREGHGSRNYVIDIYKLLHYVMPREGHGSRNMKTGTIIRAIHVMPREGHGSRNKPGIYEGIDLYADVMPREGHGSRNKQKHRARVPGHGVMPREGHGSRNTYLTALNQ